MRHDDPVKRIESGEPLVPLIIQFLLTTYAPVLFRTIRKNVSMKSISWIALFGALLFIPVAIAAVLRSSVQRTSDKRYDTADYLGEDPL